MGRPTKKQQFINYLFKEIETEDGWLTYSVALYKEALLNHKIGWPRLLYRHIAEVAGCYWDYQINEVDSDLTKEELVTDMGDVLDDKLTRKLIYKYTGVTAL